MAATIEILESSIVGVGDFNPAIFTPDWLERNKLIGTQDAESARKDENYSISKQACRFGTEYFNLQVLPAQFSLMSKGSLTPAIKDLASGILTLVLHTPIKALGLNFMAHYKLSNLTEYHAIGDKLAPKDAWAKLFPDPNTSIGLLDLTIVVEPFKRGEKPTSNAKKRITIQPSMRVKNGVFISMNDHYDIEQMDQQNQTSAQLAVHVIEEHWKTTWDQSMDVFAGLLRHSLGG